METNFKFKEIVFFSLIFFTPTIASGYDGYYDYYGEENHIYSYSEIEELATYVKAKNNFLEVGKIGWEDDFKDSLNNRNAMHNPKLILETEQSEEITSQDSNEDTLQQSIAYQLVDEFSDRAEVERFRNFYLQNPKRMQQLYSVLESATEYRLYVRKAIRDRNLPAELEYLPVVESNYKSNAKSKSGALGLWQFMSNSVKPFLTLNEYVDERLDPWKSTDAGLSKLEYNYKTFNDWLLALAAYNCGNGAMTKAIKRGNSTDYWYLAEKGFLPNQTKEYIPKLIAIADLVVNAEKYEIELPNIDEEYALYENKDEELFDFVEVDKPYTLSSIARKLEIDEATLRKLNPSLTREFTPPAAKFNLKVPLGMSEATENAIASITPIELPYKYKVVEGDSLWAISRRFGVTVQAICDTNGIKENAILKIGKILYIPIK